MFSLKKRNATPVAKVYLVAKCFAEKKMNKDQRTYQHVRKKHLICEN